MSAREETGYIGNIAQRVVDQNGMVSAARRPPVSAPSVARIDELWDRMKAIFGAGRWIAEYGEFDTTGDWGRVISDLTDAELARGYSHCAMVPRRFLPSSAEFRALCRPEPVQDDVNAHACDGCHKMLPYYGHKHRGTRQEQRIVGRSADGQGYLCNVCNEARPLPYADVVRKLGRTA